MGDKFGCAIDVGGHYAAYGRIVLESDTEAIVGYDLKLGERLVALPYPYDLIRARTNEGDTKWVESATPEEIAAWELEHPASLPPTPTLGDRLAALEAVQLERILGGVV